MMKKLIALTLAILMVVSMVACSKDEKKETPATTAATTVPTTAPTTPAPTTPPTTAPTTPPAPANDPAVEAFVAEYGDMLIDELEGGIAESAGMTCTSTIEVAGNGFIVYMNVNGMNNLTADEKAAAQAEFDAMGDIMDMSLALYQTEIPELQYFTIVMCEEDGDVIASITADGISSGTSTDDLSSLLGTSGTTVTLEEFVELGGEEFAESMEANFLASAGMTCTSTVEAIDNGLVISLNIDGLNDLSADEKAALQILLEAETATLEPILPILQAQVPDMEYMSMRVCEEDGDLIAELRVG